mmetsp:Transcript_125669/g.235054  ORF Transcript_125669/g.235054 Transcript_125669/m.235054 type:complete len:297 (+) Transcript_125669:13-903(+)
MGCSKSKYAGTNDIVKCNRLRLAASSSIPLPNYWSVTDAEGSHRKCVACESADPSELTNLQVLFDKTRLKDSLHRLKIERVVRVEDSEFWDEYKRSITYILDTRSAEEKFLNDETAIAHTVSGSIEELPLTTRCLPEAYSHRLHRGANETYLFHATSRKAADAIIAEDFKTNLSGKANGQVLGRGVYLAESAAFSDEYAVKGPSGFFCMLVVRAVLGKVHATSRYTKMRGRKLVFTTRTSKLVREGKCDSVLGDRKKANTRGIREYCVANSTQLYPEYLVLYSREKLPDEWAQKKA